MKLDPEQIKTRIAELGPWFHNMEVGGVRTAPDHFLGDYPALKWRAFSRAIPENLAGKSVLDIGCNAGFYSMEMKRRGASRVLGIDFDTGYLDQARFAASVEGFDIEFRQLSVYDVGALKEKFDVVIFMGVLYHLRHPLLALDLVREHVARDLMIFQSMQRGSQDLAEVARDYEFAQVAHFDESAYPKLHFVEHDYAHDPTNWWIPNRACAEAMLRSSGFEIVDHPEPEVYICKVASQHPESHPVYPARPDAQ